jgi:hypothetical protein
VGSVNLFVDMINTNYFYFKLLASPKIQKFIAPVQYTHAESTAPHTLVPYANDWNLKEWVESWQTTIFPHQKQAVLKKKQAVCVSNS